MKLCIVGTVAAEDRDPVKMQRIAFFRRNYELAKSPDTTITFLSATGGVMGMNMPWDAASSAYIMALNGVGVLEGVIEAERLGFDAAIIHCGHDPGVFEAKQAVDIPVIGLLEAAATMATLMAGRYGVILIDENARWLVSEAIHRYGLAGKLVGLRPFPASVQQQAQELGQPAPTGLEHFKFAARQLIADGAEVVLTACSGHSPMARLAMGAEEYPNGMTEVDGVPIVDMLSCAVRLAEMQVALKRAGSPWISRKGLYHQPSQACRAISGSDLRRVVPSFWLDTPINA